MGDKVTSARYRLMPLDKSGFVYLGVNVTDGKQAALFVLYDNEFSEGETDKDDLLLREVLIGFSFVGLKTKEVEIDFKSYHVFPWSTDFDSAFVRLIDRLTDMRMKNASVVSMTLQLEMPLL